MKTVVRLFKHFDDAEATMIDLNRIGLTDQQIGLLAASAANPPTARLHLSAMTLPGLGAVAANDRMVKLLNDNVQDTRSGGVVGALVGMGLPKPDAARYVERVLEGETLEAVTIDDDKEADAIEIMHKRAYEENELGTNDGVIPVVREELRVGKREVDAGGVRITTHVNAHPVDRTITVRDEHVEIERRKIDRGAECADDAFRDRTIDMNATSEEVFTTKRARVVEEIRVHKDVKEHVETVRDAVRHTEVNVAEYPGDKAGFDPALYADHFKRYGAKNLSFDSAAPAYRFGEQVAVRAQGANWNAIEPRAKAAWEGQNPGTWDRYADAIRYAWDRKRAK